ncbi:uncharacterized protein LOC134744348 isoform X2 [Cydia strobilella]|uniref:uncharacterized protein LOC134744348 isoform X2 n=1 Tax=Cydia strobilella TaxID=1100964 RepID=UPI003004141C
MSDMIINDSVPVDKKWNELIKYNIFIMKLVEFGLSFIIMILPASLAKPKGHMYCVATGPTFVISLLLVILYVRKKVPIFMEKLYLCFQIAFVFGAFVQCFILNLVLALVLNILPLLVESPGFLHCLASGPTLVLSVIFIVLYLVDQVPFEAEMYYAVFQIVFNTLSLLNVFTRARWILSIYVIFYIDLIIVLAFDVYYMHRERGWNF